MLHVFYRAFMYLGQGFGKLAGFCTLLLVFVTVYDVLLRYAFRMGSIAVQEFEWHLFSAIFLLGAAYTLRQDEHVRVDLLYSRLSERGKAVIDLLGTLFFLLPFCALLVYVSIPFVQRSFELAEQSADPGGLPFRFAVKALIPLGFLLLGLEGLALFFRKLSFLLSPKLDKVREE